MSTPPECEYAKVNGFERYRVYSNGEVWSEIGTLKRLKPYSNGKGYYCVRLAQNKSNRQYLVSRLMADAFLPVSDEELARKPEVDHRDTIRSNNQLSNLRRVSKLQNSCGINKKKFGNISPFIAGGFRYYIAQAKINGVPSARTFKKLEDAEEYLHELYNVALSFELTDSFD